MAFNVNALPDDLPPGEYDVKLDNARYVVCRDGSVDLLFETTFRGPRSRTDPTLLHITKHATRDSSSVRVCAEPQAEPALPKGDN